jgi:hypothetical protein
MIPIFSVPFLVILIIVDALVRALDHRFRD